MDSSLVLINIGSGEEISIGGLAFLIRDIVGFTGHIEFDTTKPDGTPRKLSDVTRIHSLEWQHQIDIRTGIRETYDWILKNKNEN
jgi:GDP-L-fucose synthase